jgi:TonB-linked SusC/RagA family outer membrane protein
MRKSLLLLTGLVLCSILTFAQQRTVTGRVTDAQGQPVPFATIRLKNAKGGVSADADGNFSIKANPSETLIVTGAGIQMKEVAVNNETTLTIQITRQNSNLDEVVVTALGVKRSKSNVPYATQQISGDDITKNVTTNVVNNMQGKIAGLQITASNAMGGSSNTILRGMRSLTQSNQALYVVDGVPYDNTITTGGGYDFGSATADLNPDDIASITVLKGAAASALYGSRGSNGVIVITSKRGSNRHNLGVTASFGVSAGSPDPSTLPSYQLQYGQGYDATTAGFVTATPSWATGPITTAETGDDAGTGPLYDKNLQIYNWDAFSPTNPNFHKATPWQPAAHHSPTDWLVTPWTTTENVTISSGGDNGTFKFGYTRDDEKGYIPNSSIKKNIFNLLTTYNITRKITAEAGLNYVNEYSVNRYLYQYTAGTNPMTDFRQWWPTNVDVKAQKADYFSSQSNATWNWSDGTENVRGAIDKPAYHDNLYWFSYQNPEKDSRNRYTGHVTITANITDWLQAQGFVSEDYYNQTIEQRADVGSQATSFYSRQNTTFAETNYRGQLNFNKKIGDNFDIRALVGGNIQKDNIPSIFTTTNGGLVQPGFWSISNSAKTPAAPIETQNVKEINSVFGSATITWKDLVTLDGSLRRDVSSTLPTANNVYYYPSVSGSFNFSKLLTNASWLTSGKAWVNYAQVGGDAPYYSVYNSNTIGTPINGQPIMTGTTSKPNPNLVPEKNKAYEAGLEMYFLNNRVGFNVDYYHSVQSNEILPITVSTTTGYNSFLVNGGSVRNQGVEATLNLVPVKTRNFTWNMTFNWAKNNNTVLSLYGGQPSYAIATLQNSIQIVAEVGKPYGVIRGTDYKYIGGQKVIDGDGYYEQASNTLSDLGNFQPVWTGSVNNTLTYRNFSFGFLIDVRHGGEVYSLDMDYGSFSGLYPRTAGINDKGVPIRAPLADGGGIILKGVTEDGKPNTSRIEENYGDGSWTFGSNGNGTEQNKEFVYDASFIKLREASFGYSIPAKTLEGLHSIKGIDLILSGRNLFIFHKNVPYSDPEQGQAAGNASMGFQNGAYPTMRTLNFLIKVKF